MKKMVKTIIIAVVTVAVLVGLFFLVKFMPTFDDEEEATDSEITEEYVLVNHIPSEIEKIEVQNEYGEYTLLSYTPTVESVAEDGTTSEATEATEYTLVGYEDMELLTGQPDALANDVSSVTSTKIANDGSQKSDFGFDSPRATVKTTFTNGDVTTICLGNDAPSDLGAYIMIEGHDEVYLMTTDAVDSFLYSAMSMISTEIGSSAATEDDAVFDKMVFGGSLFGEDVTIEHLSSPAFSESYKITSPDNTIANETVLSYMVNAVRNLNADEVIAVGVEDSDLAEYGLDDPYVTVEAEYPDLSVSYRTSRPDENGDFYLLNDGIIYKINEAAVPWVTYTYEEMLPTSVMSPKLSGVDKITVEVDDEVYEFDITRETTVTEVTDTDTDTEVETTTTTVKCGDTVLDESNFNIFYQNLTSAQRSSGGEISSDKKAVLTVTFEFSDSTTGTAVYYEAENRKCPVLINGTLTGTAFETYVTTIISDVAKVAAGETVTSIY